MAIRDMWINLPVEDVKKSAAFFSHIGFMINPHNEDTDNSACFLIGSKNNVLMLFPKPVFETFTMAPNLDIRQGTEVLMSFDVESRSEVDEIASKAVAAGGIIFSEPSENQGWMYGCSFTDLDGHRWNVLHMDMEKMPV